MQPIDLMQRADLLHDLFTLTSCGCKGIILKLVLTAVFRRPASEE